MKRLQILTSILAVLVVILCISVVAPNPTAQGHILIDATQKAAPRSLDADVTSTDRFASCSKKLFRSAPPKWMTVRLDGYTVTIPYSLEWRTEDTSCLNGDAYAGGAVPYKIVEATPPDTAHQVLWFGRPSDDLTSIDPEYGLYREPATQKLLDTLPEDFACGQTDVVTPLEMTVDGLRGWRYFNGGAKWCAMYFRFQKGDPVYTLSKNLEPSLYTASYSWKMPPQAIDAEMRRIVGSIKGE